MAVGVQLSQLVKDLRAEIGHSLNAVHGVSTEETHKYLLRRTQQELYEFHDWPTMMVYPKKSLLAGNRTYDYPTNPAVEFDQINGMWVSQGTHWYKLEYGLGPEDYSVYSSDDDERSWPPRKWRHDPENDQFEVWPIPNRAGSAMISGKKTLSELTSDAHTCDLDGPLIVLFAAASILARQKSEDASLVSARASQLLRKKLGNMSSDKRKPFRIGGA